jgi:predicted dehydrogenase
MPQRANRRQFLQTTALSGIGFWIAGGIQAQESKSPNERIAMASIGVGGKGSSDSADAAKFGDLVAICDVDDETLNKAGQRRGGKKKNDNGASGSADADAIAEKFAKAKKYNDFRKMLDEMGKSIDAVTVSTADHMHAPASLMAMRMGKHCFCQKPLTHSIYEARLVGQVARQMKVATQMGNQGTATSDLRQAAALLRAGAIGAVKEVHIWTNRPYSKYPTFMWPEGQTRPAGEDPIPSSIHWDLWLGVARKRAFKSKYTEGPFEGKQVYHPFVWRGWWDFGTGSLGDMACHNMNMAFMGLDLRDPISVQAETAGHNKDSYPSWSIITYEFAATEKRPAVKMVWYDGGKLPPAELMDGESPNPGGGTLVIGEKGKMLGNKLMGELSAPEVEFPKSPGHFEEWVRAIKGGEPAMSNFPNYASPLTETALLGNLAVWVAASGHGEKVRWDAANMRATNVPGLESLVRPMYPVDYTLGELPESADAKIMLRRKIGSRKGKK